VELENTVGVKDMLWCQGAQNIGLSNHKLAALKRSVWWQCTLVPVGQTYGRTSWQYSATIHSKRSV